MRAFLAVCTLALLTLSGCSDDGGDDPEPTGTGTGTATGTGTSTGMGTTAPTTPAEPIVLTGSASGALDCTLESQGQAALTASSVNLPAEASGRAYTLAFSGGQAAPSGFDGCIGFGADPATGGLSGTVPEGATAARIAVDGANGITFTLTIA